jgi:hypothetical protein
VDGVSEVCSQGSCDYHGANGSQGNFRIRLEGPANLWGEDDEGSPSWQSCLKFHHPINFGHKVGGGTLRLGVSPVVKCPQGGAFQAASDLYAKTSRRTNRFLAFKVCRCRYGSSVQSWLEPQHGIQRVGRRWVSSGERRKRRVHCRPH